MRNSLNVQPNTMFNFVIETTIAVAICVIVPIWVLVAVIHV